MRALLATRANIQAARFEVPSAKVSTTIQRAGQKKAVPESTPELRRVADERGVAFVAAGAGAGILVVPVPRHNDQGARGYVTVRADVGALQEQLQSVALRRFDGINMLVADDRRRAVASVGAAAPKRGADSSALVVWKRLPDGTPWTTQIGLVATYEVAGESFVGGVRTVPELGWAVGSWRSEAVAYANLNRMQKYAFAIFAAALFVGALAGLAFARAITLPVLRLARQARRFGQRQWRNVDLPLRRGDELGQLARSMEKMAHDLEGSELELERQTALRGDLSRFLSKELVDAIISGRHPIELGGRRREVTVLFADIVAFTPLAENRSPEEVVTLLNELFTMLSEIVFRHGGVVDKFIGDCIMGVWGAPLEQPDHAERALLAAEDMLRFLETTSNDWRQRFGVEVRLGIGVNSGEAIVGNVGSKKRMEYTVIGDVVNVAARLETVARPNQVLVAAGTYERAGDAFVFADQGEHAVAGREGKVRVYSLELDA